MRHTAQNGQPRQGVYPAGAVVLLLSAITRQSEPSSFGKRTRKPNSVYAVIPLGAALPRALVSDLPGGSGHCMEQPFGAGPAPCANLAPGPHIPPYLVLLRVGFTLPPPLLPERCALTAPFHPYPGGTGRPGEPVGPFRRPSEEGCRGGMFSVALAVREPSRSRPGRYPAHCPAEFGLSSPGIPRLRKDLRQRPPGPPASV